MKIQNLISMFKKYTLKKIYLNKIYKIIKKKKFLVLLIKHLSNHLE